MRERANYDTFTPNINGVPLNDGKLLDFGEPFRELRVTRLAVDPDVQIRLGRGGKTFRLRQGDGIRALESSPPLSMGVYLTCAGAAGAAVEIVIVKDDQEAGERGPAFEFTP